MAKRKFDEASVTRDEAGRFASSGGGGTQIAQAKQHDIRAVMAGQAAKYRRDLKQRAGAAGGRAAKPKADPKPAAPEKKKWAYKKDMTTQQKLKRQKQTRKTTGYGFTNVR